MPSCEINAWGCRSTTMEDHESLWCGTRPNDEDWQRAVAAVRAGEVGNPNARREPAESSRFVQVQEETPSDQRRDFADHKSSLSRQFPRRGSAPLDDRLVRCGREPFQRSAFLNEAVDGAFEVGEGLRVTGSDDRGIHTRSRRARKPPRWMSQKAGEFESGGRLLCRTDARGVLIRLIRSGNGRACCEQPSATEVSLGRFERRAMSTIRSC